MTDKNGDVDLIKLALIKLEKEASSVLESQDVTSHQWFQLAEALIHSREIIYDNGEK